MAIADNGDFNNATARLAADALDNGTNIAAEDLPDNLDDIDGSHNGKNYVAYTFYIRSAGKTDWATVPSSRWSAPARAWRRRRA